MHRFLLSVAVASVLALIGAGCERARPIPDVSPDFSISYQAGGCYGTCPVYSVSVSADGKGEYEGLMYVQQKGKKSFTLSAREIANLEQDVQRMNFFLLKNEYIQDQTGDSGSHTIRVMRQGVDKTIRYDYAGTAELKALAEKIKKLSHSDRFVSVDTATCLREYASLRERAENCTASQTLIESTSKELSQKKQNEEERDALWLQMITSPSAEKRLIGAALMKASLSIFYTDQWKITEVSSKLKSPSGQKTVVVFGQNYGGPLILRGFYVVDAKGSFLGSYVVTDVWEHFAIEDVSWKDENTIQYKKYLAAVGEERPPEILEYKVNGTR